MSDAAARERLSRIGERGLGGGEKGLELPMPQLPPLRSDNRRWNTYNS